MFTVPATLTFTFLSYPIVRVSYQDFRLSYRENRLSGFPFIVYQVLRLSGLLCESEYLGIFNEQINEKPRDLLHCRIIKYCGFLFAVTICI